MGGPGLDPRLERGHEWGNWWNPSKVYGLVNSIASNVNFLVLIIVLWLRKIRTDREMCNRYMETVAFLQLSRKPQVISKQKVSRGRHLTVIRKFWDDIVRAVQVKNILRYCLINNRANKHPKVWQQSPPRKLWGNKTLALAVGNTKCYQAHLGKLGTICQNDKCI